MRKSILIAICLVAVVLIPAVAVAQLSDPFSSLDKIRSALKVQSTPLQAGKFLTASVKSAEFNVFVVETTEAMSFGSLRVEFKHEFKQPLIQAAVALGQSDKPLRVILDTTKVPSTFIPLVQTPAKYYIFVYGSNVKASSGIKYSLKASFSRAPAVSMSFSKKPKSPIRGAFTESSKLWFTSLNPTELQAPVYVAPFVVPVPKSAKPDIIKKICFRIVHSRARRSMDPTQTFLVQIGNIDESKYLSPASPYQEGEACACTSDSSLVSSSVGVTVSSLVPGKFLVQAFANLDYCPSAIPQKWSQE